MNIFPVKSCPPEDRNKRARSVRHSRTCAWAKCYLAAAKGQRCVRAVSWTCLCVRRSTTFSSPAAETDNSCLYHVKKTKLKDKQYKLLSCLEFLPYAVWILTLQQTYKYLTIQVSNISACSGRHGCDFFVVVIFVLFEIFHFSYNIFLIEMRYNFLQAFKKNLVFLEMNFSIHA